jgi:oligoendopeptidase F
MLASGGSERPEAVVSRAGLDLKDAQLWQRGLGMLEEMIQQAEAWAGV